MRSLLASSLPLLTLVATTGCSGGVTSKTVAADSNAPMSCALSAAGSAVVPYGDYRVGGTVALAKHGERTLALVADEDAQALVVVDVDQQKPLSETPLGAVPSQVMVMSDGRIVVALRDTSALAVYEVPADLGQPLRPRCAIPTATEPVALAATPDDAKVLVSSGWGHSLTAFAADDLERLAEIDLPREPRAVIVSDDGRRAFVSHAVGSSISVINLETHHRSRDISMLVDPNQPAELSRRPLHSFANALFNGRRASDKVAGRFGIRAGCQGYALAKTVEPDGRILAPQVLVDPGDPENNASGYGEGHMPTEMVNVAVIDDKDGTLMPSSIGLSNPHMMRSPDPREVQVRECLLPRAAAVDSDSSSLFVTCFGIGALVAYDASSANPVVVEKGRWEVGAGPSGVRIDSAKRRAIVWSQFDRQLDVVHIGDVEPVDDEQPGAVPTAHIALAPSAKVPSHEIRLGRSLFHAVGDARVSNDGRACASCHPDGRDDAITWATPEGPRRTKMLAGRLRASAPYSWNGDSKDVATHVMLTFERLSGQGLRGMELDALIAYLNWMRAPVDRINTKDAVVVRGKDVFHSEKAACSSCHSSDETFADGKAHDVGSRAKADQSKEFDTPDLRFLSGRGPYFHDGRYATLAELLKDSDGRMGHTAHLSTDDLKALEAYLLTL